MKINLRNSYQTLGKEFYRNSKVKNFTDPQLIIYNKKLADKLNIKSNIGSSALAQIFSGQKLLPNASMISLAYSGHQFGHFVPTLGDGRAVLIGEVLDKFDTLYDIQLKGCGPTDFSRGGDGLSSIGPVIREYLLSEAMFHLGVKTTRALAAVTSSDKVFRESPLPVGIFTRVAKSHIRVGTFQYFASRAMKKELVDLTDYSIMRLYPHLQNSENKYREFFLECSKSLIELVNHWLSIGFIHGVMNTDNTSISGETLDYGPCAFIDDFSYSKSFSFIDKKGRYRYENQTPIIFWNISRLAECLVEVMPGSIEQNVELLTSDINSLKEYSTNDYRSRMCKKFGILKPKPEHDELISSFLTALDSEKLDFTNSFRFLCDENFKGSLILNDFKTNILKMNENQARESLALMRSVNPVYIPRNHQIEKAIVDIIENNNFDHFYRLDRVFESPYTWKKENEDLIQPPSPSEVVRNTFCGT